MSLSWGRPTAGQDRRCMRSDRRSCSYDGQNAVSVRMEQLGWNCDSRRALGLPRPRALLQAKVRRTRALKSGRASESTEGPERCPATGRDQSSKSRDAHRPAEGCARLGRGRARCVLNWRFWMRLRSRSVSPALLSCADPAGLQAFRPATPPRPRKGQRNASAVR